MSDFSPGVASAKAAGIKVERAPYPSGPGGVRLSLDTVAEKIREGQSDPRIVQLAGTILVQAGFNGRGAQAGTNRERVGALLDWVRGWLLYAPDAPGTERVASAAALACVAPNLCLRLGDCDDQLVLLGSLIGASGIPVRIVKQNFGPQHQEHVLVEAQDERGAWFYADPSTNMPVGHGAPAVHEVRVDPMQGVLDTGSGAEIITMGRPFHGGHGGGRHFTAHRFHGGNWWGFDGGDWVILQSTQTCGSWGAPLHSPPAALAAEAARQIDASHGAPVSIKWSDGGFYLFTVENSAVTIRPCVGLTEAGVGAPATGVGLCDYDLLKSARTRLINPWMSLYNDANKQNCPGFSIDQRAALDGDYQSFLDWYNTLPGVHLFCGDVQDADLQQARDFERRLDAWRKIVAASCQVSEPDLPPLRDDDPRSPNYKPPEGADIAGSIKSILTTVAVVGGIGVGVYLALPFLKAASDAGARALTGRHKSVAK